MISSETFPFPPFALQSIVCIKSIGVCAVVELMFTHSATQFEVSYPFEELKHIPNLPKGVSRLRQILLVYSVQFCSGNDDAQLPPPLESVAMVGKAKTFRSSSCEVGNEKTLGSLSLFLCSNCC